MTNRNIDPQDVYCDPAEAAEYRKGVFRDIDEEGLPEAPEDPRYPARGAGPAFRLFNQVPRVPKLRYLIGPSVIALGMGLGAGEFLLWPNLIAVNGFSIWWLFIIGVLTQFFVILEIERWTIVTGESVFGGMARLDRWGFWPWLFLVATLVSFFWPGWASQSARFSAEIIAMLTGMNIAWQPIALAMLSVIWLALVFSKVVYNALERFEIFLVLAFFPMLGISLLAVGVRPGDVAALAIGAVSVGTVPRDLMSGSQFPTLLIAVAYAGSGGTLLLAQSLWLRDKGFGMAAYKGRVTGFRGKDEPIRASGFVFDPEDKVPLARIQAWLHIARRELLLTFVLLILLSVVITTLLVGATIGTERADLAGDLSQMIALQSDALAQAGGAWLKVIFLLGGTLVLFSTQLGIVDTVSRIASTIFHERYGRLTDIWTPRRCFLIFLNLFVAASMTIIIASWAGGRGLRALQPNFLVLIAGPITIASMYLFALVVGVMNARRLPVHLAPSNWSRLGVLWAAILWGWFTAEQLTRVVLGRLGSDPAAIEAISWHPVRITFYALWAGSVVWFGWMLRRR